MHDHAQGRSVAGGDVSAIRMDWEQVASHCPTLVSAGRKNRTARKAKPHHALIFSRGKKSKRTLEHGTIFSHCCLCLGGRPILFFIPMGTARSLCRGRVPREGAPLDLDAKEGVIRNVPTIHLPLRGNENVAVYCDTISIHTDSMGSSDRADAGKKKEKRNAVRHCPRQCRPEAPRKCHRGGRCHGRPTMRPDRRRAVRRQRD